MNRVKYLVIYAMLSLLAGCGGGGGASSGTTSGTSAGTTTVSGVASKGIIKKGIVKVYSVDSTGTKGEQLTGGATDDNGAYSLNIGSYSGPIVVEVSGKYTDEATGKELEVPVSAPLHAVLDNVTAGGSTTLPVTPLTDLAFRQAGTLSTANIKTANALISSLMQVDIINTIPVAPTAAAFASATQDQKNYALILASVSQIMATKGTALESVLADLNSGVGSTTTGAVIYNALTTYMANGNNMTGENTIPVTLQTLQNKRLTLALSGTNLSAVRAIGATLKLPAGLTLGTDASGVPLPKHFQLIGNAATASMLLPSYYVPAAGNSPATLTLSLVATSGGLAAGDIISIDFDVASGSATPVFSADNLSGIDFRDKDGAILSGPVLSLH